MNDDRLYLSEISADRTVKDELSPEEQAWKLKGDNGVMYGWVGQRFTLRDACENGDGTVPLRAGKSFTRIFRSVWQYRLFTKRLTVMTLVRLLPYALL